MSEAWKSGLESQKEIVLLKKVFDFGVGSLGRILPPPSPKDRGYVWRDGWIQVRMNNGKIISGDFVEGKNFEFVKKSKNRIKVVKGNHLLFLDDSCLEALPHLRYSWFTLPKTVAEEMFRIKRVKFRYRIPFLSYLRGRWEHKGLYVCNTLDDVMGYVVGLYLHWRYDLNRFNMED